MNTLTEEQKRRMELNRRRALQKRSERNSANNDDNVSKSKKGIFNSSMTSNYKSCDETIGQAATPPEWSVHSLSMKFKRKVENQPTPWNSSSTDLSVDHKSVKKFHNPSEVNQTSVFKHEEAKIQSYLSEEQRLRMAINRRKALEKKQKTTNDLRVESPALIALNLEMKENKIDATQLNSHDSQDLAILDSALIHIKRTGKNDSTKLCDNQINTNLSFQLLSMPKLNSSIVTVGKREHEETNEKNIWNENIESSQCQLTRVPETCEEVGWVITDEQRAIIEQKRLLALQKKQSKAKALNLETDVQSTVRLVTIQPMCSVVQKKLLTPEKQQPVRSFVSEINSSNRCLEIFGLEEKNLSESVTKLVPNVEVPQYLMPCNLSNLPPDLCYSVSRCLPVEDGNLDCLIENADLDQPLLNGWTLYDHQKEGVLRALRMRRLILAFDMGLGKTIIGCVWAKAFLKTFEGLKVFVVAPVSLTEDWRRTATEATALHVSGNNQNKEKVKKKSSSNDILETLSVIDMFILSWSNVIGYLDIISKLPDCTYIVICDEAHNMQSVSSKRTEDALKMVSAKKCLGVLLLSGTPMKNGRPTNLFPLLKAVKHPFGDNQRRFEFYFCNGQQRIVNGREVWDANGSSNLKALHLHTSSHIFRLTKDECMSKELSSKKREYKQVPVSSRHQLTYNQALKDLGKAFNILQSNKCSGECDDNILSPFNELRLVSSTSKVDATVALANDILKAEDSIVIFTCFVSVAKEIHKKLDAIGWSGLLLTGETVCSKRQTMVDDFQSGLSPVFVATYGAGGTGLTLTAACTVILIDRPWTPGDVNQAEDRVRRIGQTRPVRSIWISSFPIDMQIDSLLDHKEVNSNAAVDGKNGWSHCKAAPKISIPQLVKMALGNDFLNIPTQH